MLADKQLHNWFQKGTSNVVIHFTCVSGRWFCKEVNGDLTDDEIWEVVPRDYKYDGGFKKIEMKRNGHTVKEWHK